MYCFAGSTKDTVFPDALGCSFSLGDEQRLVVAYADQSIIVWNITDLQKVCIDLVTQAGPLH